MTGGRKKKVERSFEDAGESSQPEEQEPNDGAEQATLFELGSERRPVRGEIATDDDVDWYAIRAVEEKEWLIILEVRPDSELDPRIDLEISSENTGQITYDNEGGGKPERIRHLEVTDDVVRFAVQAGSEGGTGAYELVFKKQLSGGAVEREPNDTRPTATTFEFPGEVQGFYDRPKDRDWFHARREETPSGIYRLSITPTGKFPHRLEMFTRRKAEEPYLSVETPPRKPAGVPNLKVPEKIEGLWLSMHAGSTYDPSAGYRLRAVPHPTDESYRIEGEPNDSTERAVGVEIGEVIRGYLHEPSDLDHFRVAVGRPLPSEIDRADGERAEERRDVAAGPPRDTGTDTEGPRDTAGETGQPDAGAKPTYIPPIERVPEKEQADHVIQVGLRPIAETDRLALVHQNPTDGGSRVVAADQRGQSVKLCNLSMDEGLIEVGVRGKHIEPRRVRDDFTYELTTVDILREVDQLEIEPNDGPDAADRLPFGTARTGFIAEAGDRDVYAFGIPNPQKMNQTEGAPASDAGEGSGNDSGANAASPTAGTGGRPEPVSVEIALTSNRLNLGFDVLDSQGAKIAEIDRSGAGINESTSLDLPPGLYFVEVESARGFECRPYEISVSRN